MNSNTVHLIATDPPFNKGRDFHATPDSLASGGSFQDRWSWERDVHQEWVDQISDDNPPLMEAIESARHAHSDGMGAFMCFMSVRLMEMHRILRSDGSIYLHCDYTASHYLKACMDAIFGWKSFRNEILWVYGTTARGAKAIAKQFARNNDSILFYSKHAKTRCWNYPARTVKVPLKESPYRVVDGECFKTAPRGDYTDESIERLRAENRVYVTRNNNIRIKYFAEKWDGEYVWESKKWGNVWDDIPDAMHMSPAEKTGAATQKPLKLYKRMIEASSNEGDIVLDPFAGCATTPIAAEQMDRQWVAIDLWDRAHEVVIDRLRREAWLSADGVADTLFTAGEVHYETEPPERTDFGETAAPKLRTRMRVKEPGPYMSRAAMYEVLLSKRGKVCEGCDPTFDDRRYLELDHNTPRADGGLNHISNRILLCSPCNRLKSHTYTLSGLRRENAKRGYMAKSN
ncbi:DNA methyltransferase [Candidatus Palauibacter soopunensis]|uniref:DNA methyltransferase n=1 Tax=Candidatus Palauibacter soopunensis TaxID=3056739 RepID=UPI00287318B2|nr:DNA methyltransferase [Candidatus Palauibacter soopunensis]